jgi:dissimilatory sulfite reductase (desulfoviridin) alpha/beta subunit
MIEPGTADIFRDTVSDLRSLYESKGVSFHNLSLPENRCVRLLVKTMGRQMLASSARSWKTSAFMTWESCRPGVCTATKIYRKTAPLHRSLSQWHRVQNCRMCDV